MNTVKPDALERRTAFEAALRARHVALRKQLADIFAAKPPHTPAILEIGSGHGHFLTAYAESHPHHWCLGIDVMIERIRRAERKRERAGHPNLLFLRCEAMEFLGCLPPETRFHQIFVLFPDPWPKKRHHKNRLLGPLFFNAMAAHCAPGAQVFFRTDHNPYFDQVRTIIQTHPKWNLSNFPSWPYEPQTVFQARADSFSSLVAEPNFPL